MWEMLFKQLGFKPDEIKNHIVNAQAMLKSGVDHMKKTDDRLARIEKLLGVPNVAVPIVNSTQQEINHEQPSQNCGTQ